MNYLISDLKKSILFENMPNDELEKMLNSIKYKLLNLNKNEIIFDAFSYANSIGIILSGDISVEKILPCGKQVVMFTKSEGELFGEVAVFSKANEYPCNVVAKTKCRVVLFNKEEFLKILFFDKKILDMFLYLISKKAFCLNLKVESLSFTSVKQRIAHSLIRDFNVSNNNDIVTLPFSKKVWADNLNTSRSSLYRELDSLCDESIIHCINSNGIKILDIDKLNSILME